MAVLAVNFSEKGRNSLGMVLLLMNLSIAIISFITMIIGIALAIMFHQQRDMLKGFSYSKLTSLVIFCGLALTAFHLFGSKLSFDCANYQTRDRFKRFMVIYMWLMLVALILLMTLSICTSSAIYELAKGYEKGFMELMDAYDSDKNKRREIDLVQVRNKCCGSKGYK